MRFLLALALAATLSALDKQAVEFSRPGGKPLLLDLHVPDGPGASKITIFIPSAAANFFFRLKSP